MWLVWKTDHWAIFFSANQTQNYEQYCCNLVICIFLCFRQFASFYVEFFTQSCRWYFHSSNPHDQLNCLNLINMQYPPLRQQKPEAQSYQNFATIFIQTYSLRGICPHLLSIIIVFFSFFSVETEGEPDLKKLRLDKRCCAEDLECTLCCRYNNHKFVQSLSKLNS